MEGVRSMGAVEGPVAPGTEAPVPCRLLGLMRRMALLAGGELAGEVF